MTCTLLLVDFTLHTVAQLKFTIKSKPLRKGLVKHFDHLIKFKRDIDNILD